MINIIVTTGVGDIVGSPIISNMFTDTTVALERGTYELDKQSNNWTPTTIRVPYTTGLVIGDLLEIQDTTNTLITRGKVVGISIEGTLATETMTLSLEVLG